MIRTTTLALCAGLTTHALAQPSQALTDAQTAQAAQQAASAALAKLITDLTPVKPPPNIDPGMSPPVVTTTAASVWGAGQPNQNPPYPQPPAGIPTLQICTPRTAQCANYPWYPWAQADANNQVVTSSKYVVYIAPGTYTQSMDLKRPDGTSAPDEVWYIGQGKSPADTVIDCSASVNGLMQGKACVLVSIPRVHLVNLTIKGGDQDATDYAGYQLGANGEGGVAGVYIANVPTASDGGPSVVTLDNVIIVGNNNGVFCPNEWPDAEGETDLANVQVVIRNSWLYNNAVHGGGYSHDIYCSAHWLSVINSTFLTQIEGNNIKSRGPYAYVAGTTAFAWAGAGIDRPWGGKTITAGNTIVAVGQTPPAQRGQPPLPTGNHLYSFGEELNAPPGLLALQAADPTLKTWVSTGDMFWIGRPDVLNMGHCKQILVSAGFTLGFAAPVLQWDDADSCVSTPTVWGSSGPGTVTGWPALGPGGTFTPAPGVPVVPVP